MVFTQQLITFYRPANRGVYKVACRIKPCVELSWLRAGCKRVRLLHTRQRLRQGFDEEPKRKAKHLLLHSGYLLPVAFAMLTVEQYVFEPNSTVAELEKSQFVKDSEYKHHQSFGTVQELRRRYKLGRVLGEGTFAVVRIGHDKITGSKVAIKEIRKDLSDEQALQNEIDIMKMTGFHEHIISLIEIFDSEETLYLVMDLAEGGELFDRIIDQGELSEQKASYMIKEALLATKHLHERDIVHLDIKPENLLLTRRDDTGHIKLADFGLAISIRGKEAEERCECVGTPAYWAPELVRNEPFGRPADVWALGCVLYIMLCGSHPFDPYGDDPEATILARVAEGKYDVSNKQYMQISSLAKDLIRHMLDPCPETRYTAQQTLEHPWISEPSHLSSEPLPSSNIQKLKCFRAIQLLRAGMENMLNDPRACDAMFNSFDADGDGYLTPHEFSVALNSLGLHVNEKELDEILQIFDENRDGKISRKEFDSVMNEHLSRPDKFAKASISEIEMLFNIFDRDRDGYIAKNDFKHVLGLIGSAASESMIFQNMNLLDNKPNGLVDFAEFAQFYRKIEKERMEQGILRGASIHMKKKRTVRKGFAGSRRNLAHV